MDPTVITEIADYYRHENGYTVPPMTPFAGESINVTRAEQCWPTLYSTGIRNNDIRHSVFQIFNIIIIFL